MLLLGIDIETGGAKGCTKQENFITEIGMVLYDTELKAPVEMYNVLVDMGKEIDPFMSRYTHITTDMLKKYGKNWQVVENIFKYLFASHKIEFVLGHNVGEFDLPQINVHMNHRDDLCDLTKVKYIDTLYDIEYEDTCASKNLTYLAGFHGMVNSFAHRAVTDVLMTFNIFEKYESQWPAIYEKAQQPLEKVVALVDFKNKDLARDAGFRWEPEEKIWYMIVRPAVLATKSLPFNTMPYSAYVAQSAQGFKK